jgi:hypothetical protein
MSERSNLLRSVAITGVICSTVCLGTFLSTSAKAATISTVTLGNETSVASSTTVNGITYQGYSRSITSFASGGNNWNVNSAMDTTLTLQRSGSTAVPDRNKQVVWERCSTATNCTNNTVRGTQPTTTQAALAQNNIYLGTDNFLTNTGNGAGNQSDVERADFVFSNGYYANSNVGVTVFERGANTAHDVFAIAAITGFDTSSNPIYSSLNRIVSGWGATDLLTSSSDYKDYLVLNNNATGPFARTNINNQTIGGELILLTDLVAADTPVYGYSLFAGDTYSAFINNTCTIAQLSNTTNTNCYANTTVEANGGIDLLSVNIGVSARAGTIPTTVPTTVPEPLSIVGTILSGIAAVGIRKRLKAISH